MNFLYKQIIRRLLFLINPELVHDAMISFAVFFQRFDFICSLIGFICKVKVEPIEIKGIKFPNRVGLAAGFDKDCSAAKIISKVGFGFLELGTVTLRPQPGNPKPRLFRLPEEGAIINRMGFNNIGAIAAAKNLEKMGRIDIPIGINIGKNADCPLEEAASNYLESLEILYPYGDYFTLNISSPNTKGLRTLHESDKLKNLIEPILNFVNSKTEKKPVFIKISPDIEISDLENISRAAREMGFGLIATNTTIRRDSLKKDYKDMEGGLSGRPLKELSNDILKKTINIAGGKIPIMASGGIVNSEAAAKKLELGADLVQVYTGLIYEGPFFVKDILKYIANRQQGN
ncbi:MAG: quinone-dependent dihydroorotate dehydrogenase [Elusimicrobiota bacterium]|nr:quinone-dependent dihydroorotate dehydrogenase [Elusimicrobiota bacterium]